VSKVAVVELSENVRATLRNALELIGGIDDLNRPFRPVTVKVGVFNPKDGAHTTVPMVDAIVHSFNRTQKIYLTESDNYRGKGSERLQIWKELFSDHVVPFSLSEDTETIEVKVADERIKLPHILFKPNVFVSTHVLRHFEKGSVLKNLLGLIPDRKKVRFHKKLEATLLDLYEAIGGIDLAVLDGTFMYPGVTMAKGQKRTNSNIVVVGRDAVAVEAVGAAIVGMDPEKMPVIKEAVNRGLGEGNVEKIEVLGSSIESQREKIHQLLKSAKKGKRVLRK
jgi:uncharacterized protein (DUF362 family)